MTGRWGGVDVLVGVGYNMGVFGDEWGWTPLFLEVKRQI